MPILAWTLNERCNTFQKKRQWRARAVMSTAEVERKAYRRCNVRRIRREEDTVTSIEPKLRKALTGISGILVTPFDPQDKVAPDRLTPIVDRAIGAGVHILVANGNTGEFYGLINDGGSRKNGPFCRGADRGPGPVACRRWSQHQ